MTNEGQKRQGEAKIEAGGGRQACRFEGSSPLRSRVMGYLALSQPTKLGGDGPRGGADSSALEGGPRSHTHAGGLERAWPSQVSGT